MKKIIPQNIYDNPDFFAGYSTLRKNDQGFNTVLEQPAIRSLLPDVKDMSVIDLGCGFGDLCRFLRAQGARSVLGIDVSEKMLAVAKTNTQDTAIQYQQLAIEDITASDNSVDLVVSSVALHYIADYSALIKKIHRWLKLNGYFIFSVEHPICTANPFVERLQDSNGNERWPVLNYRSEGQFEQKWFVEGVVKYHRTIQTYVNELIAAGFTLCKLLEPMPTDKMIEAKPEFAIHKIRPPLLVISARK